MISIFKCHRIGSEVVEVCFHIVCGYGQALAMDVPIMCRVTVPFEKPCCNESAFTADL
jgi:hypothetical protein